ncbi:MAG: hypothetical protein H7A25_10800 [Leptospiraceae bacterium]|nr:hypothetical protein [Leptospiraceae bacterium]MCP5500383.1 hypothetical protein [Leptospiraceae bacterium]
MKQGSMLKRNIDYIGQLIKEGNPAGGILHLTSDAFKYLEDSLQGKSLAREEREVFDNEMKQIIDSLYRLEKLIP